MVDKREKLSISKEFKEFIIPLTDEEYSQLEANLITQGCREALIVWEKPSGQRILIDGHNRYQICEKHDIPFKTKSLKFSSADEVKLWMVDNQMGRRNLTPDQLSYYRGVKYLSLRKQKGGYENVQNKGNNSEITSELLSNKYNVSESTIKRDAKYAEGIHIIQQSNPKLKTKILSGEVKVKKADVQTLSDAKNPSKLTIRNEADLYNKAQNIRSEILDEVESKVKKLQNDRIEKAQLVLEAVEPVFLKRDDRVRKIKGMILSAINKAIDSKDAAAIKELRTLIDRLADEILD